MKNLSNKTLTLLSIVFILLAGVLIYYSYLNFEKISSNQVFYKEQNKTLKREIDEKETSIEKLREDEKSLDLKLKELKEISNVYDSFEDSRDYETIKKLYSNHFLQTINLNFDNARNLSLVDKTNRYRKLIATYFGDIEVENLNEANGNVLISNLSFNNFIINSLNEKIVENNNRIFKKMGLIDYYIENKNYLIKTKIFEKIEKDIKENQLAFSGKETKDFTDGVLYLKSKALRGYDLLLFPNSHNSEFLSNLSNNISVEKKNVEYANVALTDNLIKNSKEILKNMVFGIDVYSQNIDFMGSYNILDKTYELDSGIQVLRYLVDNRNRLYMVEERRNGKPTKLVYFDSSGNPFFEIDIQTYKSYYFEFDGSKEGKSRYNEAVKLYNDF
ncbi:hypothetical protein [Anaerosphaera multitolerans]|uniref:Uncharacterized protein n=1 Tax=Anaerosphaera multitolerans TaxID=2487351 RepID=A0A437S8V2_9FIRM|nr:hypothetical protein [Anaerosphaera multitolerans]RVU55257.1 hypothetical protein EF514_03020 [Anaerosphaera multitolerans]